jgi:hypothetical protein
MDYPSPKGPHVNNQPLNDSCANIVRVYAERIDVPQFDRHAIERRSPRRGKVALPWWRQYAFAAIATIALIAWAAPAVPALIADVQSAMQLFLQRNGQMVPATDREVTIDQAMRDLPFRVVPPSGVPIATPPMIREVSIPGDVSSYQLMVQYASSLPGPKPGLTAMPALTIIEMSASSPQANIAYRVHPVNQAPLPALPQPQYRPQDAVRIQLLTETWIANGTRISLLGNPNAITQAQLQAIRRAMGG